jgi:ferritin-like metal-binding protein YciE
MSHSLNTLQDLYISELRNLYIAEKQVLLALPSLIEAANNNEFKEVLAKHLMETQHQVIRLDYIFNNLGITLGIKQGSEIRTSKIMGNLVIEIQQIIDAKGNIDVKDAALISAAQRIEHYEIALYGATKTYAKHLGNGFIPHIKILEESLNEECVANIALLRIAEGEWLSTGIKNCALPKGMFV